RRDKCTHARDARHGSALLGASPVVLTRSGRYCNCNQPLRALARTASYDVSSRFSYHRSRHPTRIRSISNHEGERYLVDHESSRSIQCMPLDHYPANHSQRALKYRGPLRIQSHFPNTLCDGPCDALPIRPPLCLAPDRPSHSTVLHIVPHLLLRHAVSESTRD